VRFLGASRRVISLEFNSYVRPPELGSKPAIDAGRALQNTRSRGRLQTECHRTAAAFPRRKSAGSPSPSGDAVQHGCEGRNRRGVAFSAGIAGGDAVAPPVTAARAVLHGGESCPALRWRQR